MPGRTAHTAAALLAAVLLTACGERAGGPGPAPGQTLAASSLSYTVEGDANAAAGVLRERARALGLDPGEPRVEGSRVTFAVSRAATPDEREGLVRPGHLTFRPVTTILGPADDAPGAGGKGDCADPAYRTRLAAVAGAPENDAKPVAACNVAGDAKYVLAPVVMAGNDVTKAAAMEENFGASGPAWVVDLELRDAARWESITETLVGQQLGIVLDGQAYSAPSINEKIPGGAAQISGTFTENEARLLAAVLKGGRLPARVRETS